MSCVSCKGSKFVSSADPVTGVDVCNQCAPPQQSTQPKCCRCGLLDAMPWRDQCLDCILKIRGQDDDSVQGIGDS
jgi:hypothetical protein